MPISIQQEQKQMLVAHAKVTGLEKKLIPPAESLINHGKHYLNLSRIGGRPITILNTTVNQRVSKLGAMSV